jgi:hypothetical protein
VEGMEGMEGMEEEHEEVEGVNEEDMPERSCDAKTRMRSRKRGELRNQARKKSRGPAAPLRNAVAG